MIYFALQEMNFSKDHLVVQPSELGKEAVDERDRGLVLLCLELST